MIKNFWKQFAEWGTGLEGKVTDIFLFTTFRLTAFYFLAGFLLLVGASLLTDNLLVDAIRQILIANLPDPNTAEAVASTLIAEELRIIWLTRFVIIIAMAVVSYVLAVITLGPIRQAFESQRHFIANASHELRTPLAIMKTTSEVALMDRSLTPKDALKTVKSNLEEIKRMSDTLQVLLSFSGYSRAEQIRFSPVNFYDAVSRAIEIARPAARNKKIRLLFSGENPSVVEGNRAALEELTLNLLKNAIAYTPEGGTIDVSINNQAGKVWLSVKDTGIGIPEMDLPHIFDPFYRGANYAVAKNTGSVGLGLAIVKQIANLHQAKVDVKSEPSFGTDVSVRFAALKR